jgi:membrane-bound lytic murein transglycosylase A
MPPPVKPVPPQELPPVTPPVVPEVKPEPAPLFTPVAFDAVPGWAQDDLRQAWPAFTSSCTVLVRKPDWKDACTAARAVDVADAAAVRAFFETWFVPNQVRAADGADTGLITGYYEPMLHGARRRGGAYQTPLYKVPDDLLTIDLASVYPDLKGMRLRGRLVGKKVVPYSSRAEIDRADIPGKELLFVDDATDAFFLEVQGSGRVVLDTGETVRVAYADQNGHPYKAIGRWLVEKGELNSQDATMQGIRAWIVANPSRRQELFNANPSYVFFREERLPDPKVGPKGSLGVALTPARSVAVDASFIPLGAPVFLATTEAASEVPMQRLVMAQDTGGAIRGAVRADFFFGFGPEATENAGRMKQRGSLWVLLPKGAAIAR